VKTADPHADSPSKPRCSSRPIRPSPYTSPAAARAAETASQGGQPTHPPGVAAPAVRNGPPGIKGEITGQPRRQRRLPAVSFLTRSADRRRNLYDAIPGRRHPRRLGLPHTLQQQLTKRPARHHPPVSLITDDRAPRASSPSRSQKSRAHVSASPRSGGQQHVAAARVPDLQVHALSPDLIHTPDILDHTEQLVRR